MMSSPFFLGLLAVSAVDVGLLAFTQMSRRVMADRARRDPVGRTYLVFSTGAVQSEALAVYGLVVTLLSGSMIYVIGFSLATWGCLGWIWRFKQNLGSIPNI